MVTRTLPTGTQNSNPDLWKNPRLQWKILEDFDLNAVIQPFTGASKLEEGTNTYNIRLFDQYVPAYDNGVLWNGGADSNDDQSVGFRFHLDQKSLVKFQMDTYALYDLTGKFIMNEGAAASGRPALLLTKSAAAAAASGGFRDDDVPITGYYFKVFDKGDYLAPGDYTYYRLTGPYTPPLRSVELRTALTVTLTTITSYSIAADKASRDEGNGGSTPFTFTLTRVGATDAPTTVDWTVTGTGDDPADAKDFAGGTLPSGLVTFAVGETSKTITVNVAGDNVTEYDEGFTVTLSNPTGYGAKVDKGSADATIVNDDAAWSVAALDASKPESNKGTTTPFTFTVTRAGDASKAASITMSLSGYDPADFAPGTLPTQTVSLAAGSTSATITFNVRGDDEVEPDEPFTVTLSNPSDGNKINVATAKGAILNDDATLAIFGSSTIREGHGGRGHGPTTYNFTVTRDGTTDKALSAKWHVQGTGATPATAGDFAGGVLPSGTADFAPGESIAQVSFGIQGDYDVEEDESFDIVLDAAPGLMTTNSPLTATIMGDDVGLKISPASLRKAEGNEGTTPFIFTVTRTGALDLDVPVAWSWSFLGQANPVWYDDMATPLQSQLLTIAAGQTTATLTVDIIGDTAPEFDETFSLDVLGGGDPNIFVLGDKAVGTVLNDDLPAIYSVSAVDTAKPEGTGANTPFVFSVTRTGNAGAFLAQQIGWKFAGSGSAPANDGDFSAGWGGGAVFFTPDGPSTQEVTVDVTGDTDVEPDEGFTFTIFAYGDPTFSTIGTATATGLIKNDDTGFSIKAASASRAEGTGANTPFTFTISRNASTVRQTVAWHVDGITADGSDFAGGVLPGGTLDFAFGVTSRELTLSVLGDSALESDESFTMVLDSATGRGAGIDAKAASAVGVIFNDEATLSIAALSASKPEGTGGTTPFTFTVTRTDTTLGTHSAKWAVAGIGGGGTVPAAASDFAGGVLPSGTVSFAPGDTSKVVTVLVAGDSTVELNERFAVTLSGGSLGTTIGTDSAEGVILNDDKASTSFAIATAPATVVEGNTGSTDVVFTVTRSGITTGTNAVTFKVAGSGANPTGADDFAGGLPLPTTLSFAPGDITKTITVSIAGDTVAEPDEAFTVTLSGATNGAAIATASASRTILSDDATLSIAATSASKPEGTGGVTPFTFIVSRTGGLAGASKATWTVAGAGGGGTVAALAGDFAGGAFPTETVAFAAGETSRVITVNVAADIVGESNDRFAVTLSAPTDGTAIDTAVATSVILNDDTSFAIATAAPTVVEGNAGSTAVVFTVTRSGISSGTNAVSFAASGSGANPASAADIAGGFPPITPLTFLPGDIVKTITVNVAGDTAAEPDEAFAVTLSSATNGAAIAVASAARTILDDDASLSIARTSGNKPEGTGLPSLHTFTVTRTGGLSFAHAAKWAVAGASVPGTVQANAADFTGGSFASGTVSFAAGDTAKVITVSVAGDVAGELNEAFGVTLSAATAGAVIATPSATSLILNDDTSFQVTAATANQAEGNAGSSVYVFTVGRSGNLAAPGTVNYAVAGTGAAPADAADFVGGVLPTGTLSFLAGEGSKTVTVAVVGDTTLELDEGFQLQLSNATGGAIAVASLARTILADEATVSIAATSASKPEGNAGTTPFTFTVTRTGGLAGASSASWTVAGAAGGGTVPALAGDFAGGVFPTGTVSFVAGEASKVVTVNVTGDALYELNDRFSVTLSAPSVGTSLGTASAQGIILDDDAIISTAANQTLAGTAGPDVFFLGGGLDSVTGGGGLDVFRFLPAALGLAATNATTMEDFNRALGEKLDLSAIDANAIGGLANDAFSFIGTATFNGTPGQLRWQDNGAVRVIQGNVNNDLIPDLTIVVKAAGPVDSAWFVL